MGGEDAALAGDLERRALDVAPIMVCDSAGRIQIWSQGLQRLYDFTAKEAVGQLADDLLATSYFVAKCEIDNALRIAGHWTGRLRRRRRNSNWIEVRVDWSLIPKDGAGPASIVCVETELEPSVGGDDVRGRLASIIEDSHDAIISKTLDGIVTTWNRGAEEIFGYTAEEIIGQPIAVLFPHDQVKDEQVILRQIKLGHRIENYDAVRLRKDGRMISVALSVAPIRDPTGRVIGASKIARDITDQKLTQARLEEVQSELFHVARMNDMGQISQAFAHELNQPLSAATSYLGGARRLIEVGDLERALWGCDRASEQLMRAGDVIRRLRDFVSKDQRQREAEALSEIVREGVALELVGPRGDNLDVAMSFPPESPTVLIDRVQIQQVLVNLVRNAIEAMGNAKVRRLEVGLLRVSAHEVEVVVRDSGSGINERVKARLFEPFNTSKTDGMGVGLSLCRTIIESHGGRIWADDNPGGGSAFHFVLPVA
jgi:two-component system sensor kinase FixL